ncbi:hypothetical protein [Celeribacter halophilus]|uniref:hypothetical protein n=1 Tax=Celeribacter halophilus TaxID=576117 RepID=UPI003A8D7D23
MKFLNLASRINHEEDGSVTVDWVVLTAAIAGLGTAVLLAVSSGALDLGDAVGANLSTQGVKSYTSSN